MENNLFPELDPPKKEDWTPPDEPYVSSEALKNAKTAEIFIPAWENKVNKAGGPISKQSMKPWFMREKGNPKKLKIKITEKGIEMPVMISMPPKLSADGALQQKMVLKDILNWNKINASYFSKWVIIEKLVFVYPKVESHDKRRKDLIDRGEAIPKLTIPDIDNLQKFLFDIMQNLNHDPDKNVRKSFPIPWLANDGCVFWIKNMYKCYGLNPGTYIKMRGQ